MRGRFRPQVRGANYTHVHIKEFTHHTPLRADGHFADEPFHLQDRLILVSLSEMGQGSPVCRSRTIWRLSASRHYRFEAKYGH